MSHSSPYSRRSQFMVSWRCFKAHLGVSGFSIVDSCEFTLSGFQYKCCFFHWEIGLVVTAITKHLELPSGANYRNMNNLMRVNLLPDYFASFGNSPRSTFLFLLTSGARFWPLSSLSFSISFVNGSFHFDQITFNSDHTYFKKCEYF